MEVMASTDIHTMRYVSGGERTQNWVTCVSAKTLLIRLQHIVCPDEPREFDSRLKSSIAIMSLINEERNRLAKACEQTHN